ncbi:MAG: class II glutamine amidotransferase [Deltaproteobacteria bacterium]|nr:class II glutamine amidotransferase [Deltaproteobacteria bacterium]
MCDIFALSAGYNYTAQDYLPVFAEKARKNMNGWGIGFFRDGQAFVEKSSEQVFVDDQVHESFQRLARVIDSRIIVSHISCPLSGGRHSAHNNPFTLPFLDHIWLFVNVGRDQEIEQYRSDNEPRLEAEVKAARIFEYLRDALVSRMNQYPYGSLYAVLRDRLLLLRKSETLGDILLVTSVGERLSPEEWLTIEPDESSLGQLMVIAGPDVLHLGDI